MTGESRQGPSPDDLARRLSWFRQYTGSLDDPPSDLPLRCPCCGCKTINRRGDFDICPVCYWEDDGQDDHDADLIRGGPNGGLSLTVARSNYCRFGACEERFVDKVRLPEHHELPGEA